MDAPVLKYETYEHGRIVVMTMDRPEQLNALNNALNNAIVEGWERFQADDEAWIAIITGAGDRAFSAGVDLKEQADIQRGAITDAPARKPMMSPDVSGLWKPTIAAVNGYALAGGFVVAHYCDLRIAAERATFGVSEARWNRGAPWLHWITRSLSLAHALELVLWGDGQIPAQRMYEMGFVNRVVPNDRLMDEAMAWADRMLSLAPRSVRVSKETIYRGWGLDFQRGAAMGGELSQQLQGMSDSSEALRAFAEKRKPQFTNR